MARRQASWLWRDVGGTTTRLWSATCFSPELIGASFLTDLVAAGGLEGWGKTGEVRLRDGRGVARGREGCARAHARAGAGRRAGCQRGRAPHMV